MTGHPGAEHAPVTDESPTHTERFTVRTWIPVAFLVLAALEIPWAVYLTVTQRGVGLAADIRDTAWGLAVAAAVLALATMWGLQRRSWWTAAPAAMGTTLWVGTAVNGLISVPLDDRTLPPALSTPPILAVPAALLFAAATWLALAPAGGRVARLLVAIPMPVFPAVLIWLTATAPRVPHRLLVVHGSVSWDTLDAAEILALLVAGIALLKGWPRITVLATSIGFALFVGDAWYNVMLSFGKSFTESLFFLAAGEFPTSVLCLIGLIPALRWLAAQRKAPALDREVSPGQRH